METKLSQHERIKDLIAKFTLRNNYWGYLFSRVSRKSDSSIPSIAGVTAEPNGTICFRYNPKLFEHISDESFELVLEHEGMHLLNNHIPRLLKIISNEMDEERIKTKIGIWNIAADCCVNTQMRMPPIIDTGGIKITPMFPRMFKLPETGSAEFYYFELLKRKNNDKQNKNGSSQKSKNSGNDGGSENGDLVGDHSGWGKNLNEISDINALSRNIENYVKNIISESVKNFNKQRGRLPGHLEELINEALTPPKIPYYQMIRKLVRGTRLSKFKRSPTRINRKRVYTFFLDENNNKIPKISPFPGRIQDYSFKICILLDTSGSMSKEDLLEGLSSIKNIIENDRYCVTTVIENDTKIQKEYEVKKLRDIDFSIKGRGGTTLEPGLIRARELNPDIVLCFTDGFTDNINEMSKKLLPKKIVWIIPENGTAKQVDRTGYIVRI